SPRQLVQGWRMVGLVTFRDGGGPELLHELKRLHNLGLSGGFLAIACGVTLIVLPLEASRCLAICRVFLASFLIAPIAFCDRIWVAFVGVIHSALAGFFYALQAASASGITLGRGLMVLSLFRRDQHTAV